MTDSFTMTLQSNQPTIDPLVRLLHFSSERTPRFLAGQWFSFDTKEAKRAYSPLYPDQLSFVVDRVDGGTVSNALCDLAPGSTLTCSGPYGRFCPPDPLPEHVVFVARDTGIAPVFCILNQMDSDGWHVPAQITLIYNCTLHRHLFASICEDWQRRNRITLQLLADGAEDAEWLYLEPLLASLPRPYPLIAGFGPFGPLIRKRLKETGFTRKDYRLERYG